MYLPHQGVKRLDLIYSTQSRLKPFIRMVREWRHLKALKRAGRAHELEGVKGTKAGDLIVKCPACLCPGFNLPDNWKTVADELKYVSCNRRCKLVDTDVCES